MKIITIGAIVLFNALSASSFKLSQRQCIVSNGFKIPAHHGVLHLWNSNKVDVAPSVEPALKSSYLVSGLLLATFVSNQWCRQAIYYLCDFSTTATAFQHINIALHFSKESYATLSSLGFTVVFALFSLLAGSVADKYNRSQIVGVSCLVWSVATALHARAHSFLDIAVLRAIVGASQAFFNPAAYTLIADTYPAKLAGRMNGVLSSGIYLGGGLASLSVLLDERLGWRDTMIAIGVVGILAAAVTSTFIAEPRKQRVAVEENDVSHKQIAVIAPPESTEEGFIAALTDVLAPYLSQLLLSASVLRFCAGFAIVVWKAPFVFAKFPHSESAFAGSNAAIVALGGVVSTLLGGYLSDALANPSDPTQKAVSRCWVAAVGSLLAAPCWAGFLLASTPEQAALFLLLEYLTAECWFGPTLAALFTVVPARRRGVAQGVFSVLTAVGTLGPIAVGFLSNLRLFSSPDTPVLQALAQSVAGDAVALNTAGAINVGAVGSALLCVVSGAYLLSFLLFAAAAVEDGKRSAVKSP